MAPLSLVIEYLTPPFCSDFRTNLILRHKLTAPQGKIPDSDPTTWGGGSPDSLSGTSWACQLFFLRETSTLIDPHGFPRFISPWFPGVGLGAVPVLRGCRCCACGPGGCSCAWCVIPCQECWNPRLPLGLGRQSSGRPTSSVPLPGLHSALRFLSTYPSRGGCFFHPRFDDFCAFFFRFSKNAHFSIFCAFFRFF